MSNPPRNPVFPKITSRRLISIVWVLENYSSVSLYATNQRRDWIVNTNLFRRSFMVRSDVFCGPVASSFRERTSTVSNGIDKRRMSSNEDHPRLFNWKFYVRAPRTIAALFSANCVGNTIWEFVHSFLSCSLVRNDTMGHLAEISRGSADFYWIGLRSVAVQIDAMWNKNMEDISRIKFDKIIVLDKF